jgi:hypothetical protein
VRSLQSNAEMVLPSRGPLLAVSLLSLLLSISLVADALPGAVAIPGASQTSGLASGPGPQSPMPHAWPSKAPARNSIAADLAIGPGIGSAPPPGPVYDAAGQQVPPLTFNCPGSAGIFQPPNGDPTDRTVLGCPIRVYDTTYHFGNPAIAVDPNDERNMVFTSLHGSPQDNAPTPRSRGDLTHTAFTSDDQGISWNDQPINGGGSYGETDSVTMDTTGNMYIAYLWSQGGGNETTGYGSTFSLYKAATAHDQGAAERSYGDGTTISGRASNNVIPRISIIDVPAYHPPQDLNATGNLTSGPADPSEVGNQAVGGVNKTNERIAAVWFERAPAAPYGPGGYPGWIDIAVTDTGSQNQWARLSEDRLIGPCMDGSNGVAFNGGVYVACVVEKGYNHRPRAKIGDIDIWRMEPLTGNTTFIGTAPMRGGHPTLAVTDDGYFVLVTSRLIDENGAEVQLASGWYGYKWAPLGDAGPLLHSMAGNQPVYDANVNAVAIDPVGKNAVLDYMEWQQPSNYTNPQPPPLPDPTNPTGTAPRLKDYKKILAAFNECASFPVAASAVELGTGIDPQNFDAYQERPSMFDDFQDGLVTYQEPSGRHVMYMAINDYGAMQVAGVLVNNVPACVVPPPPPPVPPVPIPQALSVVNMAQTWVGAGVGVVASVSILYLLTVKRRVAQYTVAEDK